ncbi:hypothetical protein HMSSN139_60070 [Paenibacillus sp. HMSSN-139]|nr:hypothetical protein HMSSN139_60070 [Paenibacillus sp. HMSSN-139]
MIPYYEATPLKNAIIHKKSKDRRKKTNRTGVSAAKKRKKTQNDRDHPPYPAEMKAFYNQGTPDNGDPKRGGI